jgi:hypothetical protein
VNIDRQGDGKLFCNSKELEIKMETETASRPYLEIQGELQNTIHDHHQSFSAQTQQSQWRLRLTFLKIFHSFYVVYFTVIFPL